MDPKWMNHPALKHIHPVKFQILNAIIDESQNKSPQEVLSVMMTAQNKLNANHLSFTREETDLMIEVLKERMTPDEKMKLDMIQNIMNR